MDLVLIRFGGLQKIVQDDLFVAQEHYQVDD